MSMYKAVLIVCGWLFSLVTPFLFLAGCVIYTFWTQGWVIIFWAIWLVGFVISAQYLPKEFKF